MNKVILILCCLFVCISCNYNSKDEKTARITPVKVEEILPTRMENIINAHGGLDRWNEMKTLRFTIDKASPEEHIVALSSRNTRITTENYTLGFDGKRIWLAQDSIFIKPSRARFYHNLMFYFYAMPFVLTDQGLHYVEAPPLILDGKNYPGIKISFDANIGDAPDDNYILYHDPITYKMTWLAYTVTFGKNAPSNNYNYIKYADWQTVNGLKLPKTLKWYKTIDNKPTQEANTLNFSNVVVSPVVPATALFSISSTGQYIND